MMTPLIRTLSAQLERVPLVIEGLSEADLHRSVVGSGWSPLSMSVHIREGVRFWLDEIVLGLPPEYPVPADFAIDEGLDAAEVVQRFIEITDAAMQRIRTRPMSMRPAVWPVEIFGEWRLETLEEVLCHLLGEVSCHLGHLDIGRELIDGATWNLETGTADVQPPAITRAAPGPCTP